MQFYNPDAEKVWLSWTRPWGICSFVEWREQRGRKKEMALYKSTIDRAFKEAEKQKSVDLAIKKEKTRVAKTLVETSPEEFVEMRIQDRILKAMVKGKGKGKGKGGKSYELSYYDLADLMYGVHYKRLKPEEKVKAIESYI